MNNKCHLCTKEMKPLSVMASANLVYPVLKLNMDLTKKEMKAMCDFFDIEDWMIIGPLAEELAEEKEQQKQIENDYEKDNEE